MKILFFNHIFPNQVRPLGGIFLKEMAMAMSKKVDVRVIAPLPIFPFMDFFRSFSGMRKVPFEESAGDLQVLRPRFLSLPKYIKWPEFVTLNRSILNNKDAIYSFAGDCDIFFTHWVFPDTYVALKLARKLGKKVVLVIHGQKSIGYSEISIKKLFINSTIKRVDNILVLTNWMKEYLNNYLGVPYQRIELVFNGIDTNKFRILDMMQQRSRLNLPKDKKIIMGLGRLSPEKGIGILIDAFRQIYKEKNLYLVIVGDGPLRSKIEKKIKKHSLSEYVLLAGSKPYHEIPYWLNACDLFCSSSYREEYGLNVVEALCCGKPVIATSVGIASQVINRSLNGVLVPVGSSSDLARAISWAGGQKWSAEKIASFGSNFSIDKSADNTIKILKNIIRN